MSERHEIVRGERDPLELEPGVGAGPSAPYAPYGYGADQDEPDGAHLRDYWSAVRKRLWLVLGVVGLATMLAAVSAVRRGRRGRPRRLQLQRVALAPQHLLAFVHRDTSEVRGRGPGAG